MGHAAPLNADPAHSTAWTQIPTNEKPVRAARFDPFVRLVQVIARPDKVL